ncbi:hypothetical protein [Streptomyces sp. NPDC057877]|uniref:hypothetical protein n=1 Tax=Streptomyces sp. NPDC057877 TaxID=3346269 RepID=UPI0036808139
MALILLLIFGVLVLAWWVLAAVLEVLADRQVRVPERWMVRILPGWLPTYVRQDLARARQARTTPTVTAAPPLPLPDPAPWAHADKQHTRPAPSGRHRRPEEAPDGTH